MSELIEMFIVPPYCGLPYLSHQFPVALVVVADVAVAVLVVDEIVDVVLLVFVEQDANTMTVIINKLSNNQMNFFFIFHSFYLITNMFCYLCNQVFNR
jgi:p-aminobenzoyl-glutamate transporter AbgT